MARHCEGDAKAKVLDGDIERVATASKFLRFTGDAQLPSKL